MKTTYRTFTFLTLLGLFASATSHGHALEFGRDWKADAKGKIVRLSSNGNTTVWMSQDEKVYLEIKGESAKMIFHTVDFGGEEKKLTQDGTFTKITETMKKKDLIQCKRSESSHAGNVAISTNYICIVKVDRKDASIVSWTYGE